jgi:hypothetical protein
MTKISKNPRRQAFRNHVTTVLGTLELGDFTGFTLPDNACDRRIAYQDVNLAAYNLWGSGNYEIRTDRRGGNQVRVRNLTATSTRLGSELPDVPGPACAGSRAAPCPYSTAA